MRRTLRLVRTRPRRPSLRAWAVLCALAMGVPVAWAQDAPPCASLLAAAEERYVQLEFAEAESLVRACLAQPSLQTADAVASYRLLTLVFLRQDELPDAKGTVLRLLSTAPEYEPNPTRDPPDYVALVTSVKQILLADRALLPSDSARVAPPVAEVSEPALDSLIIQRDLRPPEEAVPTAERVPTRERSGLTRWLLIGGGVVAASVAAVLLTSGGSAAAPPGDDPFPPPPAFPR